MPINEITKEDGIVGYDGNGAYKEQIGWFKEPQKKDCYKITTSGGDYIECSYDHPIMWTKNHWRKRDKDDNHIGKFVTFKNTDEIKVGDQILTVDAVPIFGEKEVSDARLLGLLIGDGNMSKGQSTILSCGDDEIYEYVNNKYDCKIAFEEKTKTGGDFRQIRIRGLIPMLKKEGLYGKTCLDKTLPDNIHEYNQKSLAKLIGGYYDADGCVTYNKKRNRVRVCLTSVSERLLREVKMQLVKFGIHSKVCKEYRKNGYGSNRDIYRLYINSYSDLVRFRENIPLLCKHKNDKLKFIEIMNTNDNTRIKRGVFKLGDNDKGHFFIGNDNLRNMRQESVTKVEYIGKQTIYNLHTLHSNTYLANNFITKQTGGTQGASFEGSEKLFYNPIAYNIQSLENVFDKNTSKNSICGFFWGAYLNRAACYDEENGEPDVIKAMKEVLMDRYLVKRGSSDPSAITQKKAEEPMVPQEAVMRVSGTIFPISDLKDCKDAIMSQGDAFFTEHYVGELYSDPREGVTWRPNPDLYPIRKFPHSNNKIEGALEIFEMPKKANGKIANGRYIAGIDPVNKTAA